MALMAFLQSFMDNLESNFPSLLVLIIVMLLLYSISRKNPSHLNLPPGPSKLPIIGNLHQLGDSPHISLRHLSEKFGPIFYLQLGHIPTVVFSSAALAKEAMQTHDLSLASRPQLYCAKHLFYNCTDIGFAPYGAYWRNLRKICTLELMSVRRVQSYGFIREEEVVHLIHRVADSYPGTTNLSKYLGMYANDVVCRSAFGMNFSEGGEYDKHDFKNLLIEYQILLGGFNLGEYFPSMEWINTLTGMKSRLVATSKRFDNFFDDIIEEHRDPKKMKKDHKDILDVLLDLQQNGTFDMPLTMDNIKALILDLFAAGTDTTFITLDWGMTELLMNPRAIKKAQLEIRNIMGRRTTVLESDLPQMHYLKAVMKEILRMHPPVPLLMPRESMEDVVIDGYDIPARTRIFINAWAIGRDPKSWENPDKFEPERYLGTDIDFRGQNFELIPFGAGRRMCPALAFGTASVELALAQLLHSFDWKLPPGVEAKDLDMSEVFGVSMHRTESLVVVAKPHFATIM